MRWNNWKKWIARHPWQAFVVFLLIIWAFNQLFPLFWMFSMSLKTDLEISSYPLRLPSWPPRWQNYPEAWFGRDSGVTLNVYFLNSVIIVGLGLLILVFVATLAGYAFGRFKFAGRKILFMFMIALIAVPIHALVIPLYSEMKTLNLINNLFGLVLLNVTASLPFSILMMQAYFSTFPKDLEDAALIDGCTRLSTFWHVVVPIAKGAISAVAIVNFVGMWNEVLLAVIVLWANEKRTMATGLLGYMAQWGTIRWGLIFAGLSIVVLPLIFFYLIFQENIMKGTTLGSYR